MTSHSESVFYTPAVVPAISPKVVRILSVDPGIANTGWAVLRLQGIGLCLLGSGVIETDKLTLRHVRLDVILAGLADAAHQHIPCRSDDPCSNTWVAVEDVAWGRNVTSALTTAAVIGAVEGWAMLQGAHVMAFAPSEVKRVVGGAGNADKRLVVVQANRILRPERQIKNDHEADAAAIGITCAVMALGFALRD